MAYTLLSRLQRLTVASVKWMAGERRRVRRLRDHAKVEPLAD